MSYISTATKFIPPEDFEFITQKILRRANYDLSGNTIDRVPVEDIIEFDFELEFVWEDVAHLEDDTTDVYALILPEEKKIILNEAKRELFQKYVGALNFTYAHELGHYVLHTSAGRQLSLFEEEQFLCRAENKADPVEYQANQFASCLLMPKPIIESQFQQFMETESLVWPSFYKLAEKLEVSITALMIRFKQLKLVEVKDKKIIPSTGISNGQLELDL